MQITFLSNYFNHHQSAICRKLNEFTNRKFYFIQTSKMSASRKKLGWGDIPSPDYVINEYKVNDIENMLENSDAIIIGSAKNCFIKKMLKRKKLVFRYSERIYKNKKTILQYPLRCMKYFFYNYFSKNVYLLAASAYATSDYNKTFVYKNKAYKWGYFPETKVYENIDNLIESKQKNSILWVARLIELKHPEVPLTVAKRLKSEGYSFTMNLIGNGKLEKQIGEAIRQNGLEDCVHLLGSMKPEQVREHMEQSEIFMFTSDFNEGWGAVLNESMNSGCAVVASHAIGSVPFLIEDGKNGLIYENANIEDCYQKVKYLIDHPDERKECGKKAYFTLKDTWNADVATKRLIQLSQAILNGDKHPDLFESGPCSKAERIKNDWIRKKQ